MKFYCTAGRGTETFVAAELMQTFGPNIQVSSTDGKSYFTVNEGQLDCNIWSKLVSLKTVERIFVQVLHENYQKSDRRGLLTLLHTRLNDKSIWEACISTLNHVMATRLSAPQGIGAVGKAGNRILAVNSDRTGNRISAVNSDIGERTDNRISAVNSDTVDRTGNRTSAVNSNSSVRTGNRISAVHSDTGDRTGNRISAVHSDTGDRSGNRISAVNSDTGEMPGNRISAVNSNSDDRTGNRISVVNSKTADRAGNRISAVNSNTAGCSDNKISPFNSYPTDCCSLTKRRKLDDGDITKVTFRVSCRVSGFPRKQLNIQRTSQQMGVLISKLLGWKIDLQEPRHEINIYLSDDTLTVGIPLTRSPLSRRTYIKHCGLRTPVAWIMVSQLDIHPGEVVLDPMCGTGTILLEGSCMCRSAVYLGMDKDMVQLNLCTENITYKRNSYISVIHGDTRHIPFPDNSVDKVVTDAPFGQNHTVTGDLQVFYKQFLKEILRVVKPGGRIVVLTSTCMAPFLQQICDIDVSLYNHNKDMAALLDTCDTETVQKDLAAPLDTCDTETVQKDLSDTLTQATACAGSTSHEMTAGTGGAGKQLDITPCNYKNVDFSLTLKGFYNVKLGETEGCIFVMQKSE